MVGMTAERSEVRLEAVGHDVDQARVELSRFYAGSDWMSDRTGDDYSYRYAAVGDTAMTLRTSEMRGRIEGDIPPGDDYIIQWLTEGAATVDVGRSEVPLTRNVPLLFPAHRPFVFSFTDYRQKLVQINRGVVNGLVAERLPDQPAAAVRFDHTVKPSAASVGVWHDTVALVSRTLRRTNPNPVLWSELVRMTAVAFLELCPPRVAERASEAGRVRSATVVAAVEHIHEYAGTALTPADIATAAGIGVRTLHQAFQRELGMSPMAFVRSVRLEQVRDELLRLPPYPGAVAEVALRAGFAHLGRFSAAYAERFGELPSETLGR